MEPKNSRTAAAAGLALIRSCGITVSMSTELMRSRIARSMRSRPTRYWFSISSPTERTRRLPRWSMSSISPRPSFRSSRTLTTARMSSLAQRAHGVGHVLEAQAHVHLHAADRREVVAVDVEEQAAEQRLGRLQRRRLARTHDAVDVDQRVFAVGVLVDRQRVADVRADIDVVDRQRRQHGRCRPPRARSSTGLGDLLAGLDVDLAGLLVDQVDGDVAAEQLLARRPALP